MTLRRTDRSTRRLSKAVLTLGFAGVIFFGGCSGGETQWAPGPDETSTRFLCEEVDDALAAVEAAEALMGKDSVAAERALDDARRALEALREYYLPLLQARHRAYDALRWHHLGEDDRSLAALREIESTLLEINDQRDPRLSRETEDLLDKVVEARAAVRAGRPDAARLIEVLGSQINSRLLKADLALRGTHLDGS